MVKTKGMNTQSPKTSMYPNSSLMMSQVVNILGSFQVQSRMQMPVDSWQAHILAVTYPCFQICRARKERLRTSQKIMATLYATNLMSKEPILGLSYLPMPKSVPKDPWVWLSTISPRTWMPYFPLRQSRVLTISAKMLTADHRGQNYLTRALTWNSWMGASEGQTPPNATTMKRVSMVILNPQMEYSSWGPLLGWGWPLTMVLGRTREAMHMQEQQMRQAVKAEQVGVAKTVSLRPWRYSIQQY